MRIENLKSMARGLKEMIRYLKANPSDHYVVLVFGSKADDAAGRASELTRIEQIEEIVDELLDGEATNPDLRRANMVVPRFGGHRH